MMFCSIRFRLAIILIHTIAVIVTSFWTQNITKWGAWQWSWLFTVRHSWNITQELTIHAINCLLVSKCFSMAPHIRSHRVPCSYFPKKLPLQLSSEQSVGDVKVMQLDWKRVPQARSHSCKSSAAITTECSRHHASWNVSWLQRTPSAVGHETAVVGQVERCLPGLWLVNQACRFELDALSDG